MFPVFVFLGVAWLLGGIWLVIALIYIIIFFMVPTPAKVIMILIVALAECVNVVEGKYEPGKGEFIEINRQIEARQKELRNKGYSYRKINEDAQLDKLKRKADRLYKKYGNHTWDTERYKPI